MSELELSNNPNVDTGFVTDGNQKNKVQLVAQLDASDIELPSSPNSDSAYVTINGKKHKVKLTAVLHGGGSGGGDVSSVNGKKGVVVLTGADIDATLSDGEISETATVTQHLQTLKNDEKDLGDQVAGIEGKIPQNASTTNQLATKADIPSGGGTDNNGLEGDYCSRYGIVDETQSGLPRMGTGNQVIVPAGLVLDVPGVSGLTTNASVITHDLTATTNCELWLAQRNVLEVTDMFWQEDEPEDGTTGYAGWWNGTEMKFKSNDTGNVWRAANAVRIAKCIFTDGNLTRLCFTGCRLLNKQEWLPLSGGALTGPLVSSQNVSFFKKTPVLSLCAKNADGTNGMIATISMVPNADTLFLNSILSLNIITPTNVGSKAQKVSFAYIDKINNGADIAVPTTGGTMVVATPPTAEGTYVLKATVAADGTVTTTWVAE